MIQIIKGFIMNLKNIKLKKLLLLCVMLFGPTMLKSMREGPAKKLPSEKLRIFLKQQQLYSRIVVSVNELGSPLSDDNCATFTEKLPVLFDFKLSGEDNIRNLSGDFEEYKQVLIGLIPDSCEDLIKTLLNKTSKMIYFQFL